MLAEIFYWVLNMSITAGITGLVVMLVGRARGIPHRVTVLLWAVPFLRMVVPVGLDRPYSLMTLMARLFSRAVPVYERSREMALSMMNSVQLAESYFPLVYKGSAVRRVFTVAAVIWLLVAGVILVALAAEYVAALREVRHEAGETCVSERARMAAVYGIWRPRIVLPVGMSPEQMRYALLHERAHIRRRDNLWRLMALTATAVHWFNPLAWVLLKRFLADIELSCDECVLAGLDQEQAREYARTLLETGEKNSVLVSALGGAGLRKRIENILSYRRMTWLSLMGALALVIAMFGVLMTNAG